MRIRDLFERVLRAKGYSVLTAQDGQEALDRVAEWGEAIDLLVTDVIMPRVSGPELVRRLLTIRPRIKVLFMSGYSEEGDLSLMSDEKRTGVLSKPLSIEQLQVEVRRVLDQ